MTDPVRAGIMEKQPFLGLAGKCFFGKKCALPQKHPKFLKILIFFGKRQLFSFEQLFSIVVRTFLGPRSEFFWARILGFWPKNWIFAIRPQFFVNGPFVALGEAVHFPPWDPFFDFPFWSYSSFRKKNPVDTSKILPPPHCWGIVGQ